MFWEQALAQLLTKLIAWLWIRHEAKLQRGKEPLTHEEEIDDIGNLPRR